MPVPRPKDLEDRIKEIPRHVTSLPPEAASPILHHERSSNDFWNLVVYFSQNIQKEARYQASFERHRRRLSSMILLGLTEAFERFLKELAAICIDHLANLTLDDRFGEFNLKGGVCAAHFDEKTIGKALVESSTWVDCRQVNDRFRRILADKNGDAKFYIFPMKNQEPVALRDRFEVVETIWQLRHSIVHNAASITRSDAMKLTLLTNQRVEGDRLLWPSRGDVWYVKRYLDETVEKINAEVARRLATILTSLAPDHPLLIDPATKAQQLADAFRLRSTVGSEARDPA